MRGQRITRLATIEDWWREGEISRKLYTVLNSAGYVFVDELKALSLVEEDYPNHIRKITGMKYDMSLSLLKALARRTPQFYIVRLVKWIRTVRGTLYPEDTVFYHVCAHPFMRSHYERGGAWMAMRVHDSDRIVDLTLMGDEIQFLEDSEPPQSDTETKDG